ncbi:aminodeoxychorismate synthase component I [Atopomonas sediminilitoris]|uniref:aminodeoxychorismate synthase component I n=1 Tax=Atopomonas sediminilitoris TaxID=2919919 RepID=UPI001F4EC4C5|nr:aminodeoxychorismate synthase component I [Atopomonas sediminilitoris]MCJ8168567.1 aminodeoxychorismate synthase component I [Atopomonas sediminilitoris]
MPACALYSLPYVADPGTRFAAFAHESGAILLDGGQPQAERARFDLMSAWPQQLLKAEPHEAGLTFLTRLRRELANFGAAECADWPFAGGLMGYCNYDFGRRLERIGEQAACDIDMPDACFGLYDWAIMSDHQRQQSVLLIHPKAPAERRQQVLAQLQKEPSHTAFKLLAPFAGQITREQYLAQIQRIQAYIQAGDCYQVNFAQRFSAPFSGSAWQAYQLLRAVCPTPFAGYAHFDSFQLLSLSPERFLRVSDGQVETRPIKGTRPRGANTTEDQAHARDLQSSLKDRAENLMIVDLLRNDLSRSCALGSVKVPELFTLESYPNVHHLVSAVTGTLAQPKNALDLLAASFPGGSITGAPKIRAMQIIDELEPSRRSFYCGSLLYLDVNGRMDSSIAIRSLVAHQGQLYCWGGGGIVADSVPEAEYNESLTKIRVLLHTLEQSLAQG